MGSQAPGTRSSVGVALLLVQIVVGYEWLVSGLTKIAHGDFPAGLHDALGDFVRTSPHWYSGFLTGVVEPHARAFAYAIEWSELAVGAILLAVAALSLRRGSAPPRWLGQATAAAVGVGLLLAVDFELANGGGFGTGLASDSFDEGVDLDTIMVALQLALLVPLAGGLLRRRPPADVARPQW
jgi:hypothetical protein